MRTITLFEYSVPEKGEERELLRRMQSKLQKINRIVKATVFEPTWDSVRAQNYVGILTVDKTTIQILPKIYKSADESQRVEEATKNLLFMLSFTKRLKLRETGLSMLKKDQSSLYEVIVYLFAKNLLETLKKNYRRDYERREEDLNFVKGKILLSKQVRRCIHDKVFCSYYELNEDILLNRILKYVCHLLASRVRNRENWTLIQNILSIYSDVSLKPVRLSDFDRVRFNRLNEDYEPFISLARLFLENASLELQSSRFRTFSLLFDMNVLFEEFIGEFLKKYGGEILDKTEFSGCRVQLQKGVKWLVEEPRSFKLIPDIILSDGEIKLIIDTKYKILDSRMPHFGVSQSDIYQMFAYARKYGCGKIVLLYPWSENLGDSPKTDILQVYRFDENSRLYIAVVNLRRDLRSRDELENLKAEFGNLMWRISEE